MAYTIGYIVYGIDLQEPSQYDINAVDEWDEYRELFDDLSEGEEELIEIKYQGNSGTQPCFVGVVLGRIDECHTVDGEELMKMMNPTEMVKAEFLASLEKLADQPFYDKMANTEPKIFITWGTS